MPDFADDTSSELERQARALTVVALVETVTYVALFYFWIVAPNDALKAIVGFFHGLIWLAFVAMTVIIRPAIGWSWRYTAVVVITGPIGGLMVFTRLRRTPRAALVHQPSHSGDPRSPVPPPDPA
ncbi:MAG TPA: DUF3817 domain-containing protein [Acidimicrobiia bacterium]|nr:DUF3817 domain-containing protein [Acidimicrobiia bacterium]